MENIYIIGSVKQADEIEALAKKYNDDGCFNVRYVTKDNQGRSLIHLIHMCYQNIEWAHRVIVVPKADGTFGDGVMYEIAYAFHLDVPVYVAKRELRIDKLDKNDIV